MSVAPPRSPSAARARWAPLLVAAAIAVLAFIPFTPALTAGLVDFDDDAVILQHDDYRGLGAENLRWMVTTTHMGHYQPLTWLSYAIDHALAGSPEAGTPGFDRAVFRFHLTNLLLHALNAALVYLLARRLIAAAWDGRTAGRPSGPAALEAAAAGAALLFAVHPLRAESVAWVTERRDVLSAFFLLAAALAYLRAFPARSERPASHVWYAASVGLLLLSLLSKAWGMTFFVILTIIDWYPLRRLPVNPMRWLSAGARPVLIQKAPYVALGLATAAMAAHAVNSVPYTNIRLEFWSVGARICQAAYGLMFYLQKLVWPTGLCPLYELPIGQSLAQPRFVAGLAFTAAAGITLWILRRRAPAAIAAAAIYGVLLAPVLGFNQSGPQLVADRYSYLANISWVVLLAGAAGWWAAKRGARVAGAGLAVLGLAAAGVLGVLAWRQTHIWQSSERLFLQCIQQGRDGPIARINYGLQLAKRGDLVAAEAQFQRAVEIQPSYGNAWFHRGNALRDLGRLADAEVCFQRAAEHMADSWRAHTALGLIYVNADRVPEAAEQFRAAVANVEAPGSRSFSPRPYLMLAAALDLLGDQRGSMEMLRKAAQYPETRDEALDVLREMEAEGNR